MTNLWRLHNTRKDTDPTSEYWAPWVDLISRAVALGVASEPVTDYIRYERAGTVVNLAAGEQVINPLGVGLERGSHRPSS